MAAHCFGSRADSAAPCSCLGRTAGKLQRSPMPFLDTLLLHSVVTSPKFTHEIIQFLFCLYASLGSIIAAAAEITKSALRPPA